MKYPLVLLCGILAFQLSAQEAYFQQETNFAIAVELDEVRHQLHGHWAMDYHNNSPDTLRLLYLHLWPNAYANRSTAFAQQLLAYGNTDFYFAPDADLGFIDSLNFTSGGQPLRVEATAWGPDVVQVVLAGPLLPGSSCRLESPFRVQVPASFSRMGHVGRSYQLTQWYPKPAVYDRAGWHPLPYLENGEYYSEFSASFEVDLTLPANYLVGATGELQTPAERAWLLTRAAADAQRRWTSSDPTVYQAAPFPARTTARKTLHFSASQVYDFAWFADPRFYVLHDTIQLANRAPIDAWAFFTDQQAHFWQDAIPYIKRATHFYADHVGPYVYPQVTALQGALQAGGGMEYPMVTVIGLVADARALDAVITHEVGHNWFYGMLATNERDHPWLDEGFNSYYDHRYDRACYSPESSLLPAFLQGDSPTSQDELTYRYYGSQYLNQPPDTPSGQLREYNYWTGAYSVPALGLRQLEGFWGQDSLDGAMQAYYRDWLFRHPQPADVQAVLEKAGGTQLGWLFQGFLQSTEQQDYAIQRVAPDGRTLTVRNRGTIAAPFPVQAITAQHDTLTRWLPGFTGEQTIELPAPGYQQISLDLNHQTLDMYRANNHWHRGALGRWEPPQLRWLTGIRDDTRQTVFAIPAVGYNETNGALLGLAVHNRGLLPQHFEWLALPLYGTSSQTLNGLAATRFRWWWPATAQRLREVSVFASFRRFGYRHFAAEGVDLNYERWSSGATFEFHQRPHSKWVPRLAYRFLGIRTENLSFSNEGQYLGTRSSPQRIYELSYQRQSKWALAPTTLTATLEYATYHDDFSRYQTHTKLRLEGRGKLLYQPEKAFHWRLFAGFFLHNDIGNTTYTPAQAFSLFDRGPEDYRYDNLYLGREASSGSPSRQLGLREGGFRAPVPSSFNTGRSNKSMVSLNVSADLPFTPSWLPLQPYLDAATFVAPTFAGDQRTFHWNAGLALQWLDGQLSCFVPLLGSDAIMNPLREQGGLRQRLGVRILLTELAPWNWMDDVGRH